MGHKTEVKAIRNQLRIIVKELLPELLTQALAKEIFDRLQQTQSMHLSAISSSVDETLKKLDQRSKDTLNYLVRSVNVLPPTVPTTITDNQRKEGSNESSEQ